MLDLGYVITAMITPFDEKGDVDYKEAVRIADYCLQNGSDTVLLAGTTGESPTLSHDEEYQLFKTVKSELGPKATIMAGTGSNSTKTAIDSSLKAQDANVDACLLVSPYYNKPSQEGMYAHFKAVADACDLPIMLYNIPGRTAVNMQPELIQRLSQIDTIESIKEAAGSVEQLKAIKEVVPNDFRVYSGDDGLTLDFMKEGAYGVVSVASHVAGTAIQEMIQAFHKQDLQKAEQINQQLTELFDVLFITSNPVPVKAAMKQLGFSVGTPRLPLVDLSDDERSKVLAVIADLNNV